MIISASRRTDIPCYYAAWFFNRLKAGFVLVRNPVNFHQISKIKLTPDVIDGIVFWTKNPAPMLNRLDELKDYAYYFQFTLTPYGADVEPHLPSKTDILPTTFKQLAEKIGADRVIWRYDPILITKKYPITYHIRAFEALAQKLHNYTKKVTISFVDEHYRGLQNNLQALGLLDFAAEEKLKFASVLAKIAKSYGLSIEVCAEKLDLQQCGISQARCIDDWLLEKLLGRKLNVAKDKTQRPACNCVKSIDIGMYNTCANGCLYCYANYNQSAVSQNRAKHDSLAPLICGEISYEDKIKERR